MAGVHAMMMNVSMGSIEGELYLMPNGVTIAAIPTAQKGKWHLFEGRDYYVAKDYADLVSVVSVYKGLRGDGEVFANLRRGGQIKAIPLNQVVTTFVDKFSIGTGTATGTGGLFFSATTFNQLLSSWDTSNVTNMHYMFVECFAFNQDLSAWDTSNVTNMFCLLYRCYLFNQDLSGWDTSNVTIMDFMFRDCFAFNQDLSGWCVSKIRSKPGGFDDGANSAWTIAMKPKWGAPC